MRTTLSFIFYCFFFQGIPCLCDEVVMDVLWAMKRLIRYFVPSETPDLAEEDSLTMSQGLRMFFKSFVFEIKPEM
jgi:hypothetical protein